MQYFYSGCTPLKELSCLKVVTFYGASETFLGKYYSLLVNMLKHLQKTCKIIVGWSTEHASVTHVRQISCEVPPSNQRTKLRTCADIAYTRSSKV